MYVGIIFVYGKKGLNHEKIEVHMYINLSMQDLYFHVFPPNIVVHII